MDKHTPPPKKKLSSRAGAKKRLNKKADAHDTSIQAQANTSEELITTLFNKLPLMQFELEVLEHDSHEQLIAMISASKEAMQKISAQPLLKSIDKLTSLIEQLPFFTKQNPDITSAQIIGLSEFFTAFSQTLQTFCGGLQAPNINQSIIKNVSLLIALKQQLNQYYNDIYPLLTGITEASYQPRKSKWLYWLRFFGIKKSNKAIKQFKVAQEKCKIEAESFNKQLRELQDVIDCINMINYGPQPYQIIIGEVCNGVYQTDQMIEAVAMGLLDTVPILGLTKSIEHHFSEASKPNQQHILKLFCQMLKLDTHHHLVDCDGRPHALNPFMDFLKAHASDSPLLKEVEDALTECAALARQSHLQYLDELRQGAYPLDHINDIFTDLKRNYANKLVGLRHCAILAYDTLCAMPESYLVEPGHKSLLDLIQSFISLIPIKDHMKLRMLLEQQIEENIHQKIYHIPEWARPKQSFQETLTQMEQFENQFNQTIEKIANGELGEKHTLVFINKLCKLIASQSKALFRKVDLSDLKKACWENDLDTMIKHHTLRNSFPNLNRLIEFETLLSHWVCDCILYEFKEDKRPRKNLQSMLNIRAFFIKLVQLAYAQGNVQVAYFVSQGLKHEAFEAFEQMPGETISAPKHMILERLDFHQMPQFSLMIRRLQRVHQLCHGSLSYLTIGQLFLKLQAMQEALAEEKNVQAIGRFIHKRVTWRLLKGEEVLVNFRDAKVRDVHYKDMGRAHLMHKDTLNELDFEGIHKRLQLTVQHKAQLFLIGQEKQDGLNAYETIVKKVMALLNKHDLLPSVKLLLSIFENLGQIYQSIPVPRLDQDTSRAIDLWSAKTNAIMNAPNQAPAIIEAIQTDLSQANLLPKSFESGFDLTAKAIAKMVEQSRTWEIAEPQGGYSQAYIKALASYLEGTEQTQVKLPSKATEVDFAKHGKTISFQDLEEESHPDIVGFAETWNIFKQISSHVIKGPPFSYENLKDTFFKAFPWAIEDENSLRKQPLVDNLILAHPKVSNRLQKSVMDLVFISLDTIGKLAGPYGELVLYNLDKIDHIITTLETVTQAIDAPGYLLDEQNANDFDELLQSKIEALRNQNQMLFGKLTKQTPIEAHEKYAANPYMNYLLSVNEQEMFYHLTTDHNESVLPPPIHNGEDSYSPQAYETHKQEEGLDEWDALTQEINNLFDEDIFLDSGDTQSV